MYPIAEKCLSMIPDKTFFGVSPNAQNAVDLFKDEWACIFPQKYNINTGGFAATYDDERIKWAESLLKGFTGKKILELGPLEAGQTFALENLGAASIDAIEVSARAYLKCLVAKEILKLKRSRFMLGDLVPYLEHTKNHYDICIACGVIYHMLDPILVIKHLSEHCNKLFIWTHYYDNQIIQKNNDLKARFNKEIHIECDGQKYSGYPFGYGEALTNKVFSGGKKEGSVWLTRSSLLSALTYYGFKIINSKNEDHINGPAIWIAAEKQPFPI